MDAELMNALNWLHSNGNLSDDEFNILYNYYSTDKRDVELIKDELRSFYASKKAVLDKINSITSDTSLDDIEIIEFDDPVNKIDLSSVSDLHKDGKDYIKMIYSDGSIRIIENNLDLPGNDLFNMLKEKYSGQEKYDVTKLFEEMTKNSVELKLYNFDDLSNKPLYDKLSPIEQQSVYIVKSKFPDNQVISGPADNIYIVRDGVDDKYYKVEMNDGVYQVLPIDEDGISYDNSDSFMASSNSKTMQKSLGSNGIPKMYDDGFMNILLFIFCAGIGSGIIVMIILNVLMG